MEIKEITTKELSEKLKRKDQFKLIMISHERAFKAKHIPGSRIFIRKKVLLDYLTSPMKL